MAKRNGYVGASKSKTIREIIAIAKIIIYSSNGTPNITISEKVQQGMRADTASGLCT